ncbi:MAG: transcriptional repressor [Bacteroidia bacterium]|nr:transcriptional repressor [Bacteroidia bacterium]
MSDVSALLKSHGLRHTAGRTDILQVFAGRGMALSEREIEQAIGTRCDRVTIYRTLTTFLEKGIIHKVPDDTGTTRYALCAAGCHVATPSLHDHIHFKCTQCGRTRCVSQVRIPEVLLPSGYVADQMSMLIQGRCPDCQG